MKQYADFEFYQNQFCGTAITDENQFKRQAIEACCLIDEMTLGRIKEADDIIKMAVCALADVGYREYQQESEIQIASESVGPHSVSYVKQTKTKEDFLNEKYCVARRYLVQTGLLYRGLPT